MRLTFRLLIGILAMIVLSCSTYKGQQFLDKQQYDEGVRVFEAQHRNSPDDPAVNYYLGRFYLAQEKADRALPLLRKATELQPGSVEYNFWLGVAYWGVMDFEKERASYLRALALDPNYYPARLYLAHNLLDSGDWQAALLNYDRVLIFEPSHPEALYNRGLALKELNRPAEEAQAWKDYLRYYPNGRWAIRAVDHLNALGDFSYRNFTIGYRRLNLKPIRFVPGSAVLETGSSESLQVLGEVLSINRRIRLKIIGYKNGNFKLAKVRAEAVRTYLLKNYPVIEPSRLSAQGSEHKETIQIGDRRYDRDESVSLVTLDK
jgi:tetratricopeptide (TPR) repeat protein